MSFADGTLAQELYSHAAAGGNPPLRRLFAHTLAMRDNVFLRVYLSEARA